MKQIREFGVKESVNSALNDIDLTIWKGVCGDHGVVGRRNKTSLHVLAMIDQLALGSIAIDGSYVLKVNEDQLSLFVGISSYLYFKITICWTR